MGGIKYIVWNGYEFTAWDELIEVRDHLEEVFDDSDLDDPAEFAKEHEVAIYQVAGTIPLVVENPVRVKVTVG